MKTPAEQVKDLLASGLTQIEIADRSGVPQPTISRLVNGVHSDVMASSAFKLAKLHAEIFGVQSAKPRKAVA